MRIDLAGVDEKSPPLLRQRIVGGIGRCTPLMAQRPREGCVLRLAIRKELQLAAVEIVMERCDDRQAIVANVAARVQT